MSRENFQSPKALTSLVHGFLEGGLYVNHIIIQIRNNVSVLSTVKKEKERGNKSRLVQRSTMSAFSVLHSFSLYSKGKEDLVCYFINITGYIEILQN